MTLSSSRTRSIQSLIPRAVENKDNRSWLPRSPFEMTALAWGGFTPAISISQVYIIIFLSTVSRRESWLSIHPEEIEFAMFGESKGGECPSCFSWDRLYSTANVPKPLIPPFGRLQRGRAEWLKPRPLPPGSAVPLDGDK